MTIDDAHGLQVGIDDGRTDKGHAPFLEVRRNLVRQKRPGTIPFVYDLSIRPVPQIGIKTAPLLLDGQKDAGIRPGRPDFQLIPYNPGILP